MGLRQNGLLTTRGKVLAYLTKHPSETQWRMSQAMDITERTIQAAIRSLREDGLVLVRCTGRGQIRTVTHPYLGKLLVKVAARGVGLKSPRRRFSRTVRRSSTEPEASKVSEKGQEVANAK